MKMNDEAKAFQIRAQLVETTRGEVEPERDTRLSLRDADGQDSGMLSEYLGTIRRPIPKHCETFCPGIEDEPDRECRCAARCVHVALCISGTLMRRWPL